jgi:hypothetical protein
VLDAREFEPWKLVSAVVLSLVLEAGLQTVASFFIASDLAPVSKRPESWTEILSLLGWKIGKLVIYWLNDYDGMLSRLCRIGLTVD